MKPAIYLPNNVRVFFQKDATILEKGGAPRHQAALHPGRRSGGTGRDRSSAAPLAGGMPRLGAGTMPKTFLAYVVLDMENMSGFYDAEELASTLT